MEISKTNFGGISELAQRSKARWEGLGKQEQNSWVFNIKTSHAPL